MGITQKSRWDDNGVEPGAGDAKYQTGQQPIKEYDNWFNKSVVDDIAALNTGMFDALYPEQQSTPNMTLKISAGKVYFGETLLSYAGGNTPAFIDPSGNPRIDIVTLNSSGTLAITQGSEAASPSPPAYPADKIIICEVYNRVGETSIKTVSDGTNGYIYKDVRPYVVQAPTQNSIKGDSAEAQTFDSITSLKSNLNRIRNKLKDLIDSSGNWSDTVVISVKDLLAELDAHTSAAAPHSGHETPAGAQAKVDALFGTFANVTGSRSLNTVYHNTSGKRKLCIVVLGDSGAGGQICYAKTDSSNPPTTNKDDDYIQANPQRAKLIFIVEPDDYYMGDYNFGGATLYSWSEWT